jgi:MYXO-CTERM domain-containing protein
MSAFLIFVGFLAMVAGEADDSPGLQGLGLILIILVIALAYRRRRLK